jgi:hypothetical protein
MPVTAAQLDKQREKVAGLESKLKAIQEDLNTEREQFEMMGRDFFTQVGLGDLFQPKSKKRASNGSGKRGRKGSTKDQFAQWASEKPRTRDEAKQWMTDKGLQPSVGNYVGKGKDFVFKDDKIVAA